MRKIISPVSVVIVNFNSAELLTQCVDSVLSSTIPVLIYVVDNASTDHSLTQLQEKYPAEPRLHIIKNSTNFGFAKAANQALSHITSSYILFLNPDCLLTADTLKQFYTCMEQYPQAGMAGCLVKNLDGTEQAGCRRHIPTPWRSFIQTLHLDQLFPNQFQSFLLSRQPLPTQPLPIEGISGACMFVRKSALEQVGPMDESYFLHCEDLDWFIRFQRDNWLILFIPSIEVVHIKGVCSRQLPYKVLWYKHRGMLRLYRKFFNYPWWTWIVLFIAVWTRFNILVLSTFLNGLIARFHRKT